MKRIVRFATYVVVSIAIVLLAACATLKSNPNDTEIQQTRKLAMQVFTAVELAGTGVQGVQQFEIQLHEGKKVDDDYHRNFQTDLLITARVVRQGLTQIQAATRTPELKNTVQVIVDNLKDLQTKYATGNPQLGTMMGIVISGLSVVSAILGV